MEILIIGCGSLVKRRIIPALENLEAIEKIHIAGISASIPENAVSKNKQGRLFNDYQTAINSCEEALVYISLPNSMHSYWARAALKSGHHVIVDKPALTEFDDAQIIVELAASKNLCVAEANVWYHHPIVRTLKFFIGQQKAPPLAIYSTFTSPAMNSRNFRYRTDMGGGAILDRASYAISCGRVLLGGMPVNVHCQKSPYLETREVETSFSLLANYDNGAVMLAFMSIEAEYRNCVEIIGCDYTLEVDRLFTPPDNYEADIIMRQNNVTKKIQVSESNSFREFIGEVVKSVESGNFSYYSEVLLEDARVMNSIKISAKGE